MAKVVAEEAVRLGVPVLAIDPQGDLVQFLRACIRTSRTLPARYRAARLFSTASSPGCGPRARPTGAA